MTLYSPPKPAPRTAKLGLVRRLVEARRCSISVLYERSYSMRMGHVGTPFRDLYFVNEPSLVDRILVEEAEHFPKSGLMNTMLELLLGQSIFVTNGETWRRQRKMIDPAFEGARIQDVFPLMRDAVLDMGVRLSAHAPGSQVPADVEMTHVTSDIIFRTIYSRPFRRDEATTIFRAFNRFQELAYARGVWSLAGVPPWLSVGRLRAARQARIIRGLLARALDERLAEQRRAEKDILDSLLEARDPETGAAFSRAELVDQIAVLFLAGHETSASALAWALHLIAKAPEIQERLHREAAEIFDAAPEFRSIKQLKLARDVFRESLRLYPPVSFITRDSTREERMRDKVVRPGSILFVSPWLIHRHREHWKDPDAFDPDRYNRPETKQSVRSAYLPFSAGPRVCLGASFAMQEGVLILSYLARHFRFEPVEGHTPEPMARLTLRSENGIPVHIFPRREQAVQDLRAQ